MVTRWGKRRRCGAQIAHADGAAEASEEPRAMQTRATGVGGDGSGERLEVGVGAEPAAR